LFADFVLPMLDEAFSHLQLKREFAPLLEAFHSMTTSSFFFDTAINIDCMNQLEKLSSHHTQAICVYL
jgi:hypothetical protein